MMRRKRSTTVYVLGLVTLAVSLAFVLVAGVVMLHEGLTDVQVDVQKTAIGVFLTVLGIVGSSYGFRLAQRHEPDW